MKTLLTAIVAFILGGLTIMVYGQKIKLIVIDAAPSKIAHNESASAQSTASPEPITSIAQTPETVAPAPVAAPAQFVQPPERPKEDTTYMVVYKEAKPSELVRTFVKSALTGEYENKRVPAEYTVQFKGMQTETTYPRIHVTDRGYNEIKTMQIVDRATINRIAE